MKKTLFIVVLASALLLSACNSVQNTDSTTLSGATTSATTTEEATTEKPMLEGKPEEYADVTFLNNNGDKTNAFASEFSFVDATYFKNDDGVYYFPNFTAGKDIVITFKSDEEFTLGEIWRESFPVGRESVNVINILGISLDDEFNMVTKSFKEYVTCSEGIYSIKIPANYVEQDNIFHIDLMTKEFAHMTLSVGSLNETTLKSKPLFSINEHANISNEVDASDFVFSNAKLPVTPEKHGYKVDYPQFTEGQDVVITFKCNKILSHLQFGYFVETEDYYEIQKIGDDKSLKKMLVRSGDTYTLTIPGKYIVANHEYGIVLQDKDNKSLSFIFQC